MMLENTALPLAAFGVTAVLHVIAMKLFPAIGLVDFPERYGHKRAPIPYPTGLISVVVFVMFYIACFEHSAQALGLLVGIVLLSGTCMMDDRKPFSGWIRLCIQVFVALVIFSFGTRIYSLANPFADGVIPLDTWVVPLAIFSDPPVLSGLFTVGWLLLTMNALNWFDGIPGQVSTLSTIAFLVLGVLAVNNFGNPADPALAEQQAIVAKLSFWLAMIAVAGHMFDFPPHKVLMGDTGAMFFGLMLGVLTIYAGGKVATAFLVLGVPLIDSAIVIIRRLAAGESVAKGNSTNQHLHHRLLQKGWSERQIILLTGLMGTAFGVAALYLETIGKIVAGFLLLLIMMGLSVYTNSTDRTVAADSSSH